LVFPGQSSIMIIMSMAVVMGIAGESAMYPMYGIRYRSFPCML